jgi:hypothetical protein
MAMERETGKLLAPRVWCRNRWCREESGAGHYPGDGCSCDGHGRAPALDEKPRLTILKAHASRLAAFACRACGRATKRMIEYPRLYFRCEPCADADRWPNSGGR